MKIGFIGFGKLGQPCGEVIQDKGHDVVYYDVNSEIDTSVVECATIELCVSDRDIVFIAVPTPHDTAYDGSSPSASLPPKDFDYTTVIECVTEANRFMHKNQLLVLISTVLPGTVRSQFVPLVTNTRFAYNPYLIAMGTVAWDMVNPEMLMIGTEDGSETGDAKQLKEFYDTIMENDPRVIIGTWDECECIKVFYNTFISAKIGLVNMIQDVAEKQGNINTDVVTSALRDSTDRIMGPSYMKAGMGDGGACHPRDNIALRFMADKLDLKYDLFGAVMHSREVQASNMAQAIAMSGDKIAFTSDSYKPFVPYTNGSYSLLVQHYVKQCGATIVAMYECPDVIVRVHESDVIPEHQGNITVFDPWRSYRSNEYTVISYGNTRETSNEKVME